MSEPSKLDVNQDECGDVVGRWSHEVDFAVTRDQTVAFAEATNDRIRAHADGHVAPPVFAVVPSFNLMASTTMDAVSDDLMLRILHGEQDIRFHRQITPGDDLTSRAKVFGVHGRSSGIVVTTYIETRLRRGDLVTEQYFSGFFRGGRSTAALGQAAPDHRFDPTLLSRVADGVVEQSIDADQTYRYADASGDPMPIHTNERFAKEMGLPGIIVHGLCTMAFTSRALIEHACPDEPGRLLRLAVRFNSPARPKQKLTTSIWNIEPSGTQARYAFETSNDEGHLVIKDGLAEVAR